MADVKKCQGCGGEIIFARTPSGKMMPLDAEPVVPNEELRGLQLYDASGDPEYVEVHTFLPGNRSLFRSHFATCPKAAQFRGR